MTSIESQPTLFQVPKAHLGNIKKCFITAPRYPDSTGVIRRGIIYILITIVLTYVAWGGRANHDSARN